MASSSAPSFSARSAAEAWSAKRAQPLAHLRLEVAGALDVDGDARELQLGAVPALLEPPEPGGLLHERAAFLGLRREHRLDLALPHDRVHRRAEADVREQLDEVEPADGGARLTRYWPSPPRCRRRTIETSENSTASAAVLVVEEQLDLAPRRRGAVARAREEDVVGLLGAQLATG